eukprot:TRINITY_DN65021_c0_g1_i1.p1 TRINITY_DN65021_c0_g1~~TRINITY_DN65021_c0_g1_i1.p1  ORF type:complete len:370 (-),score=60.88 TRINITY_DN65021_c0_g1_i1:84-1193(-)
MDVAVLQSRATHPSSDAAACCAFMSYFIVQAIAMHSVGNSPARNLHAFMDDTIQSFLKAAREGIPAFQEMKGCGRAEAMDRLSQLLTSCPRGPKEKNWDWKAAELGVVQAMRARMQDGRYNGHPIIPTYFGSYCMDGLAMALWGLWNSDSFQSCIWKTVNLLGDADTTGAIAGQLAGAVYGWKALAGDGWGTLRLKSLQRWDPLAEVGLRAALLYHCGPTVEVILSQAEGYPEVRVFAQPVPGSDKVGQIPSQSRVKLLERRGDFVRVAYTLEGITVDGYVGLKNVVPIKVDMIIPPGSPSRGSPAVQDPPAVPTSSGGYSQAPPPTSSTGSSGSSGGRRRSSVSVPASSREADDKVGPDGSLWGMFGL